MHSDGEKPKRRLRVIDQKMPTKKDDLIKMIEDWNIPTPEKPTGMRAVDLREAIFEHDEKLRISGVDEKDLVQWGQRKCRFGEKYLGKTFAEAASDEGFSNFILHKAKTRTQAMQEFVDYLEATTRRRPKKTTTSQNQSSRPSGASTPTSWHEIPTSPRDPSNAPINRRGQRKRTGVASPSSSEMSS